MTSTGTATPTRSCLKRRLHDALASSSIDSTSGSSGSSCANSLSQKTTLCKTVSFDGNAHIYFADPDYDRHSVPVAPKLSYEDLLELKMLKINLMCPQNKCAVVPVGILPLLPPSDTTPSPTTIAPTVQSRQKPSGLARHLSARNQHFVGLLDDDLASMSSTPPPSSPSDHSPNTGGIPLPMIATDEEGQLIFSFSSSDDLDDEVNQIINARAAPTSSHHNWPEKSPKHVSFPQLAAKSGAPQSIKSEDVTSPFPVPPRSSSQNNVAAMTLTPAFFSLTPQTSPTPSAPSSPFPFAPPVSTCVGLPALVTPAPASPPSDQSSSKTTPTASALNSPPATSSPKGQHKHQHHRSASSPISSPKKAVSTLSPLATPHASPTFTMPLHMHMGPLRANANHSMTTSGASQAQSQGQTVIAPPGPLAALQQRHPLSPQLSGIPSPPLVPPSPFSLNPPNLDPNGSNGPCANIAGFFGERKRSGTATQATISSGVAGHVKRASVGAPTSTLARPSSPVVKPLKS